MGKPFISFFLPSIRPFNLVRLYNSITASLKNAAPFELVVCSPYNLPDELARVSNVKYVKDFGSPVRAAQLATMLCEGEVITLANDDAEYLPDVMHDAVLAFDRSNPKQILGLKYGEGNNLMGDEYWTYAWHGPLQIPGVDQNSHVILAYIMSKETFDWVGGYDCRFETTCWGNHDLFLRLKNAGCNSIMFPDHAFMCDWSSEPAGFYNDHIPICLAHPHGRQLFYQLWYYPSNRSLIPFSNWRESDRIWARRFSNG